MIRNNIHEVDESSERTLMIVQGYVGVLVLTAALILYMTELPAFIVLATSYAIIHLLVQALLYVGKYFGDNNAQ